MIFFLSGPDTFRSREKLKEIKDKFSREVDASGLNTHLLAGKGIDLEELKTSLLAQPFLAKRRLVIIEGFLAAHHQEKTHVAVMECLKHGASDNTITVFWEGDLDEKSRHSALHAFLMGQKFRFTFDALTGAPLAHWLTERCRGLKVAIDRTAVARLIETTGSNLWKAETEIQKLAAYARGRAITVADVEALCAKTVDESLYLLTDALAQKNPGRALTLLERQFDSGATELELLNKMLWQVKNLILIKSYIAANPGQAAPAVMARQLGLHVFVVQKSLPQMESFSLAELRRRHDALIAIEEKIKSTSLSSRALLETFLARV